MLRLQVAVDDAAQEEVLHSGEHLHHERRRLRMEDNCEGKMFRKSNMFFEDGAFIIIPNMRNNVLNYHPGKMQPLTMKSMMHTIAKHA